jgi:hypothetical protein
MILGYRDKKTEQFAKGEFVKAFQGFEDQAARRLSILNAAPSLDTLRACPTIGSKRSEGIAQDSIPFASTSNGASVSSGRTARPGRAMLKFWTIIEERRSGHVYESGSPRRNPQG